MTPDDTTYIGQCAKLILKEYLSSGTSSEKLNPSQNQLPFPVPSEPLPPADRPANQPLRIGILGAGVAGMYAAMIVESLRVHEPMITYDLLEANPERYGGRLFTHRFSQGMHDYYDVGAMRYPDIPFMRRTFGLFRELDITEENGLLIPYILSNDENLNLFNGKVLTNKQVREGGADPFDTRILDKPVRDLVDAKVSYFIDMLSKDFDAGWKEIVQTYDQHSARSYMAMVEPKYSQNLISTLEIFDSDTGLYDTALIETILDSMRFNNPKGDVQEWKCIQGGSFVIADRMATRIKIIMGARVTVIRPNLNGGQYGWKSIDIDATLPGASVDTLTLTYDHVISTLPFSCLRTVDTSACSFDWRLSIAVRGLQYEHSTKVAIKFSHRWWETERGQKGGTSQTDKLTRTVIYPSYGIGGSDATMIVSYTSGQDAARIGAHCQGHDSASEKLLISTILRDLADLHGYTDYSYLPSLVRGYHAWDWYGNEYSNGAYAFFSPGQFQSLYPLVTQPYAGILHFAGEATSIHHAWLVGALNSAYRAIVEVLKHEQREDLIDKVRKRWGDDDELDLDLLEKQVHIGQVLPRYLKETREKAERSRPQV